MTRDDYVILLKRLLPSGLAWPREQTTYMHKLLEALSEEFARLDVRAGVDLINEMDPTTTTELLPDYERLVELPDDLQTELSASLEQRRKDIVRKLTTGGGQAPAFFVEIAAAFGYTVTIEEYFPFRAGRNRCGYRCFDVDWIHHWGIRSDQSVTLYFRAGQNRCGDRLRTSQNQGLEAVINDAKPAHTVVHFLYGGP